jgi:endonuclease G
MKNFLITIFLSFSSLHAYAWDQRPPMAIDACKKHSPYGFAVASKSSKTICREAYLVAYDSNAKIPAYVAYTLLPQNALGCFPRTNAFTTDKSIIGGAIPNDYIGTGYDKGHAAPDGDMSWSAIVEYESFLMTNMYPQAGSLNRGIWKLLETSVRGWSSQLNNSFTIYVGAIYNDKDKKIGNGIIVPHSYYKIVINNQTNEVAGWGFPHIIPYPNLGNDLAKFRVAVNDLEMAAGIDYKFPANYKEVKPGKEWSVDFGALTKAKRAKCGNTIE